jgi:hypothetical protein
LSLAVTNYARLGTLARETEDEDRIGRTIMDSDADEVRALEV